MANVKAYVPLNINNINLNFYYRYFYDFGFADNADRAFEGKLYRDLYAVNGYDGSNDLYLFAFGPSLQVDNQGIPRDGTVTAMGEVGSNFDPLWTATGISISLKSLYLAASTGQNRDELDLVARALNGDDNISLSAGNDLFKGFSGNDFLNGKDGNDVLSGGSGDDLILGGAGRDYLYGGSGSDKFLYATRGQGGDYIADFASDDFFQFRKEAFGGTTGVLNPNFFRARADNHAVDSNDHFIFRTTDDTLWFDADGSGAGAPFKMADLTTDFNLKAADILII